MIVKLVSVGAVAAIGIVGAAALSPPGSTKSGLTADAAHPAVIELYQSQGCSSCPPALKVLQAEADRPEVLALNFAVTYWDYLGWKDRFARAEYTQRQWDYAHARGLNQVATPQLIVNGRGHVNGGDPAQVELALKRWDRGRRGPEIDVADRQVTLTDAPTDGLSTVWLVDYDPRTIDVPIRAGENNGRTLPHRNIVTGLTKLGTWSGKHARFDLPVARGRIQRAVLVQTGMGGPIVAARRI